MSGAVTEPTLRRPLLVATAIVSLLGLVVEMWAWRAPDSAWVEALWPRLSLSAEANVPTWFASSLLLCCALAAGSIAAAMPGGVRWRGHWWGIAIALGWVSLDEVAELHEHLGGHFATSGVLYFDWVIWAAVIVAVLAVLYLPFLRALASPARERLVVAAVVYVSGALIMELPLGWYVERAGTDSLGYALIDWVEETLELVGASLALAALVAHARSRR
ncbi:MAG TPA: hypothetical protein VM513_10925 [Kofleriaceae bacterium]|jgi:hypothetical protein|nr:hypothetical protein [Kofleriaceae bacterium]